MLHPDPAAPAAPPSPAAPASALFNGFGTTSSGPPPSTELRRLPVKFVGSGSEYFRIWIVNLFLILVTTGIYYPFAKTRRLKYFYASTEVDGHPLSFHADPLKMLLGYGLLAVMLWLYRAASQVSPTVGALALLALALAWPWLWRSSLRFRAANTGWRGLRFRFYGGLKDAYLAWAPALAFLAAPISAGFVADPSGKTVELAGQLLWFFMACLLLPLLFLPLLFWLRQRYKQGHIGLAEEQSRFSVTLPMAYALALRWVGLGLLILGLPWALLGGASGGGVKTLLTGVSFAMGLLLLVPILLFGWQIMYAYFLSRAQNLVWNGTRSEHFSFSSRLKMGPVAWRLTVNLLLTVMTLGLYTPFAAVAMARLRLEAVEVLAHADPETLLATAAHQQQAAAGEAAADLLGWDVGL